MVAFTTTEHDQIVCTYVFECLSSTCTELLTPYVLNGFSLPHPLSLKHQVPCVL